MSNDSTMIFTDGSSRGNPGPAGWGAVVSFEDHVIELGAGVDRATNNQMELTAIISALAFLEGKNEWKDPVFVYSDSAYVKKGASEWMHGWIHRGWKKADGEEVQNKKLWQTLHNLVKTFNIEWKKLPAHSGIPGNVRADKIATSFADGESLELFDGSLEDYNRIYEIDLRDTSKQLPADADGDNNGDPFYITLADEEVRTHESWAGAKERVDGVSGAKVQKVNNKQEGEKVLAQWGVDAKVLQLKDE